MQREVWVIINTLFFINSVYSQEKSIYNQAYIDPFIINPACAGSELFPIVRLSVENRWIGFRNSPSTILLTGNTRIGNYDFYTPKGLINKGPLKIGDRVAFGGAVYYDNNGPLKSTGGMLSYAYHIPLNKVSRLSMGLSVYLLNKTVNTAELEPDQVEDEYLFKEQNDLFRVNFGVGLFYHRKNFFSGLSVNELFSMQTKSSYRDVKMPGYYFLAGYKFEEVTRSLDFEPSIIVRKPSDEDLYFDFYARIYFMKFHWAALSYSTAGLADIMLAVRIYNSFYIGYNYMYNMGKIALYNYGSHRISIGINLGLRGIDKWEYYN
ncbi:MAG TPA: PorP/SprF family type IX secretion system membrane protein [Bacteroidales bacterium]|jgi:type IX secretion system PorP/SprF family membrane protein|nr:PorP/SprF family type IX secretion system membrane protein [Bacteroidales bacterium]